MPQHDNSTLARFRKRPKVPLTQMQTNDLLAELASELGCRPDDWQALARAIAARFVPAFSRPTRRGAPVKYHYLQIYCDVKEQIQAARENGSRVSLTQIAKGFKKSHGLSVSTVREFHRLGLVVDDVARRYRLNPELFDVESEEFKNSLLPGKRRRSSA